MSSLQRYFLAPPAPPTAAGFVDDSFTVVDLRRARQGFTLASSAVTQLPPEVLTPSFNEPNILNAAELVEIIRQTRSEERRVGKECRSRGSPDHYKKKEKSASEWYE